VPTSKKRKRSSRPDQAAPDTKTGIAPSWYVFAAVAIALIAGIAYWTSGGGSGTRVKVTVPQLTGDAVAGENLFSFNCGRCHGADAGGGEGGPPLVHKIYEPSHHADGAFFAAVARGVRQHHWRFGDMPRIEGLSQQDVAAMVAYVRALQHANGIE
jgi:mono/diheme cytochrome c family protein